MHGAAIHQFFGIADDIGMPFKLFAQLINWVKYLIGLAFVLVGHFSKQGVQVNATQVFVQAVGYFTAYRYRMQGKQFIFYSGQWLPEKAV